MRRPLAVSSRVPPGRPAPAFSSAAESAAAGLSPAVRAELRPPTVAVLLTGMGKDGAEELKRLRDDGAVTIVQDRASAAVYGMPGEALRLGAAMLVLEPVRIGKALHTIANQPEGGLAVLGL